MRDIKADVAQLQARGNFGDGKRSRDLVDLVRFLVRRQEIKR